MTLKPFDYGPSAHIYDILELGGGEGPATSKFIADILTRHHIKTVLDMTAGTGAQSIGLANRGFDVTANDICKEMINVAKEKSKDLNIIFHIGDMITAQYGEFDAVISMFNAIGHLTEEEFERALDNIHSQLKENGLYIFDIFNLTFMQKNWMNYRFIDMAAEHQNTFYVRWNDNHLENDIMHINQELIIQKGYGHPKTEKTSWDMKIYSMKRLQEIVQKHGFHIIEKYGGLETEFNDEESTFCYIVAQKTSEN